MPKKYQITNTALALLGLIDASYLSKQYAVEQAPVCGINVVATCGAVTNSQYAEFLNIPVAYLGIIFYISIAAISLIAYLKPARLTAWLISILSGIGLLFSAYLVLLQAFVIKSWCDWCLLSAGITLLLFISSIGILKPYLNSMNKIN